MSLPVISGAECISALAKLGYKQARTKGSHARLERPGMPPVTIPLHRELAPGTLRAIIRTVGLVPEAFSVLLDTH